MRFVEPDFRRRIAVVEGASAIKKPHSRLGKHSDELVAAEFAEAGIAERIRTTVAVLVGNDQIEVLSVPKRAVALEAVDRDQIVRFSAEPIVIKRVFNGHVFHRRWTEVLEHPTRRRYTRGEVFEPRLIRRDFHSLARLLVRSTLHD